MKAISEYLSTKVDVAKSKVELPKTLTKQTMTNYLERNGFVEVQADTLEDFYIKVERSTHPVYWHGKHQDDNSSWIRFANGGHISKENPIFFMFVRNNTKEYSAFEYGTRYSFHTCKYPEFVRAIKYHFGL